MGKFYRLEVKNDSVLIFTAFIRVKGFHAVKIRLKISGGMEYRAYSTDLVSVIHESQNQRHLCLVSDSVKSGFPCFGLTSGA